jgi:hypothetical protein
VKRVRDRGLDRELRAWQLAASDALPCCDVWEVPDAQPKHRTRHGLGIVGRLREKGKRK